MKKPQKAKKKVKQTAVIKAGKAPRRAVRKKTNVNESKKLRPVVRSKRMVTISTELEKKGDIALMGLAVMGQNLILNMNDKGYTVVAYNRTVEKVDDFISGAAKGRSSILGAHSIGEMVRILRRPRKVMLMVKAGEAVDESIQTIVPYLDKGDIIIDGGNSHFSDTMRRTGELAGKGLLYIGAGISGGEEGARTGPSIMPGGNPEAWPFVKALFQAIAAKTSDGTPCCNWVGPGGAGHYVKMVHNGIEYGDMQLICETYDLMRKGLDLSADELHGIFAEWNRGDLDSYLIGITRDIFTYKDTDGKPLVDSILDAAGQKGTGKWTSINSLVLGIPVTLIAEAVYARSLSAMKEERVEASKILQGRATTFTGERESFVEDIRKALYASKIISYAQGFMLMREASKECGWGLNFGDIALMWRSGCIIRSVFLEKIKEAFDRNPGLSNLLLDPYFNSVIQECLPGWRSAISTAVQIGVPVPALATALSFYDGYRSERLPANLLQAQRDYFGAHTYERLDKPRGRFFHTNWTGTGGDIASGTYNA